MAKTTRMRLSEAGPEIAKPGYDVDTAAIGNMVFSPSLVAMRIALTGTVTPTTFSGALDDWYYKGTVTFATAFVRPPIVMVAGLSSDGTTQQGLYYFSVVSGDSGTASFCPVYQIDTYVDHFDLFTYKRNITGSTFPIAATWRYWVFQNTLDE